MFTGSLYYAKIVPAAQLRCHWTMFATTLGPTRTARCRLRLVFSLRTASHLIDPIPRIW